MVAKITAALGETEETAPVVVAPPLPSAKIYVVLGGLALKKWFPGEAGAPGQWLRRDGAGEVLVTYSPEYILRYPTVTPAIVQIKKAMWTSLKAVKKKLLCI